MSSPLLNTSTPPHLHTSDRGARAGRSFGRARPWKTQINARSDLLSPQVESRESAYQLSCDQRQKFLLQPHRLDHMTGHFNVQSDGTLSSAAEI